MLPYVFEKNLNAWFRKLYLLMSTTSSTYILKFMILVTGAQAQGRVQFNHIVKCADLIDIVFCTFTVVGDKFMHYIMHYAHNVFMTIK